jgi:hypothetical protein
MEFYLLMRKICNLAALFAVSMTLAIAHFHFRQAQPLAWVFLAVILTTVLILWHAHKDDAIGLIVLLLGLVFGGVAVGAMLW